MRVRAAVILAQHDRIALIERYRQGRQYFVFPGGKVEPGETLKQAAARETEEEVGLQVKVGRMVAEVWYLEKPQYYFLAEVTGGQLGHGMGDELDSREDSAQGTYQPMWMDITDLINEPVVPKVIAELVWNCYRTGWPETPLKVIDQPPDEIK